MANPSDRDKNFKKIVYFMYLTMTPMKDYLIALGFTYMYYT